MSDDERKKVFMLPGYTPMHRGVAEVLEAADDVEMIYGLDGEDRWRRPADAAEEERMRQYAEGVLDRALPDLQGIYAAGPRRIDRATIAAGTRLEVAFMRGSGFEQIDLEAATEHGVACVNSAGVNAAPVSDETVALMLSAALRIGYVDRYMHRERSWIFLADLAERDMYPGMISGKTVGIVGFGFIGREVARKCRDGFGMRVLAYDPFFDPAEAERQGVEMVDSLEEMIPQVDFLSMNIPLTPATRGLIGAAELRLMRPEAILVNTGRGATVDTDALVEALREKRIAGPASTSPTQSRCPMATPCSGSRTSSSLPTSPAPPTTRWRSSAPPRRPRRCGSCAACHRSGC